MEGKIKTTEHSGRFAILALALAAATALVGAPKDEAPVGSGLPAADRLADEFRNPPASERPEAWWHWMNGEVTREGLTADIEAAKEMGLSSLHVFNSGCSGRPNVIPPEKRIEFLSPEWDELMKHALRECKRVGLDLYAQNCAGWSGSGGPWIAPSNAMFYVEARSVQVAPGAQGTIPAPESWPKSGSTYYRDIRSYAFPTPPKACPAPLPTPAIAASAATPDLPKLLHPASETKPRRESDGPPTVIERRMKKGETYALTYDYGRPVTVRTLELGQSPTGGETLRPVLDLTVEAGDDPAALKEVAPVPNYSSCWYHTVLPFERALPPTTARYFRLVWRAREDACLAVQRADFSARPGLTASRAQMGYESRTLVGGNVDLADEPGEAVPLADIRDVTASLAPGGTLAWTAPADGRAWTLVRLGYRNKTRTVMPSAPGGSGLECDKFSSATVSYHYDCYCARLKRLAREADAVSALKGILIDSFEGGTQTWSPVLPDEFARRRGYSLFPYLVAYAGFIVGDRATTRRYLRDMRQTFGDLAAESYYGTMYRRAKADGLAFIAETYAGGSEGTGVGDSLQHHFSMDVPMTAASNQGGGKKMAVSAADNAGLNQVAIEAHTSGIDWGESPAQLFTGETTLFADGINRIVLHALGHNPSLDRIRPGVCMHSYGCCPSRGRVWRDDAHAWFGTLARIHHVLRLGRPVVDIAVAYGEEAMGPDLGLLAHGEGDPLAGLDDAGRSGYDWSMLSPQRFVSTFRMKDGRMGDPAGAQYRLLVLRTCRRMSPAMIEKVLALAKEGLAVSVETVPEEAPGLTDREASDRRVKAAAAALLGDLDGRTRKVRRLGKGIVMHGLGVAEAVKETGLEPDCRAKGRTVYCRHRRDGANDYYYVVPHDADADRPTICTFRAGGRTPEVFDPASGEWYLPRKISAKDGLVSAELNFSRTQPLVVVFREKPAAAPQALPPGTGVTVAVDGPWEVSFDGPRAPKARTVAKLENLCDSAEDDVRYFSGHVTYRTAFEFSGEARAAELDLGNVGVTASVTLNGQPLGVAWKRPYRLTGVARALRRGKNELVVRVANTWYNRLLGDAKLPESERVTWASYSQITGKSDLRWRTSGLAGPVALRFATE